VLVIRHAATVRASDPPGSASTTARRSATFGDGRRDAHALGARLASGRRVRSGAFEPLCRCLDTARLAFARWSVAPWTRSSTIAPRARADREVRARVRVARAGTLVLVTHMVNIAALVVTACHGEPSCCGRAGDARGSSGRPLGLTPEPSLHRSVVGRRIPVMILRSTVAAGRHSGGERRARPRPRVGNAHQAVERCFAIVDRDVMRVVERVDDRIMRQTSGPHSADDAENCG